MPNKGIFICCLWIITFTLSGCAFWGGKNDDTVIRNTIVNIAAQYKGHPYRYGASGPGSFDCSGYVSYVFKQAGILLPRTTQSQFRSGSKISRSDLSRGDLVFFTPHRTIKMFSSPGHVGIYIGGDRFIHASSGSGVRVDKLSDAYWYRHFKGARDIIGG